MAIVVGAFILGLGVGSEVGGRLADRLSPSRALRVFSMVEAMLCLFGAASPFLYYDLLYVRLGGLATGLVGTAVVQIVLLLPPTLLMGASLPLLVRGCVGSAADASARVTGLFFANVLGSAIGAVATPWVLLSNLSMSAAALVAAALNGIVAVGGLAIRASADGPDAAPREGEAAAGSLSRTDLAFWSVLFATSGFVALGLEMIWFRVIDVSLKDRVPTWRQVVDGLVAGVGIKERERSRLDHQDRKSVV